MAKIRTYTGGNVGARNLMEVPAGPHATAEAFGAGRARDLYNLGQAVENVGGEVLRIAEIRAKRADDAMIRTLDTEAGDAWRAWEKEQTETRKGLDARDLADEAAKWWEARKKSDIERLDANRPRQREMIEALYGSKRDSGVAAFERYSYKEVAVADRNSRALQNEAFIRQAEAEGLMNPAKLEELRLLRHANIRENYRGQAPEVTDEALRLADVEFHGRVANAHAGHNLNDAIQYLDRDEVKKRFLSGEWKALRDQYAAGAESSKDIAYAFELAKSDVSSAEIMEEAYAAYPGEPKRAEYVIKLADQHRNKQRDGKNLLAVEKADEYWQAAAKHDYDLDAMDPEQVRAMMRDHPETAKRVTEFRSWIEKAGGKVDPHYQWIDEKLMMAPSELRAWLNATDPKNPGGITNYELMLRKTGGNADEMNRIRAHARKTDGQGRSEGGGTGGSAKFDVNNWFEANYGGMYKTGWIWKDSAAFDPKLDEAKSRKNAFWVEYQKRLNAKEGELKRSANFDEQEDVAQRIANDVYYGSLVLESNFFNPSTAAQAPAEMTVPRDQLLPDQAALYRGNDIVIRTDADGFPVKMGKRNIDATDDVNGIPQTIAEQKPKSVETALDKGTFVALSGNRYEVEKGWHVVDTGKGALNIYDQYWDVRDTVGNQTPAQAAAMAAQAASGPPYPMPRYQDRKMTEEVVAAKRKHGDAASFVWDHLTGRWILVSPEGAKLWGANGAVVETY